MNCEKNITDSTKINKPDVAANIPADYFIQIPDKP